MSQSLFAYWPNAVRRGKEYGTAVPQVGVFLSAGRRQFSSGERCGEHEDEQRPPSLVQATAATQELP